MSSFAMALRIYVYFPFSNFPLLGALLYGLSGVAVVGGVWSVVRRPVASLFRFPFAWSSISFVFLLCISKSTLVEPQPIGFLFPLLVAVASLVFAYNLHRRIQAGKPEPQLPVEIRHFGFQFQSRYVTDLRWDFWLVYLWFWIPLVTTCALWGYEIWARPYTLGFVIVIGLAVLFLGLIVRSHLLSNLQPDKLDRIKYNHSAFVMYSLGCLVFGTGVKLDWQSGFSLFAMIGLIFVIFDSPLEKWIKRMSKQAKEEYESLQAPNLGL